MGRNKREPKSIAERTREQKTRKDMKKEVRALKAGKARSAISKRNKRLRDTVVLSVDTQHTSESRRNKDVRETIKKDDDVASYLREESVIKRFKRGTGTLFTFAEKVEIIRLFTNLRLCDEEFLRTKLMDTVGKAM